MFPPTPSRLLCASAGILLAAALVSLRGPDLVAQEKQDAKPTQSRVEKKSYAFKEAGKDVEYALFVPSTYDKEKKSPLVVALHGLGGSPGQFIRTRGLTDQAEKYGFAVAAPMGYSERGWYGV